MRTISSLRMGTFALLALIGILAISGTYIAAHAQAATPPATTGTHIAGQTSTVNTKSFQLSAKASTTKAVTNGKFTSYALPHNGNEFVKGPDGAFWYTASSANAIGRFSTNGTVKEYTLPAAGYDPEDIINGPDGALWFAYRYDYTGAPAQYTYEIARLTTTGTLTIFQVSTDQTGFIESLTAGPDGGIWFEFSGSNPSGTVDRITPSAQLTTYLLTIPMTNLVAGSDGAFWFGSKHQLGRFTTTGTLSLTPLSNQALWPDTLASGPNSTFLFTDNVAIKVGFITKSGFVTAVSPAMPKGSVSDIIALDNGGYAYTSYITTDRYGDEIDYISSVKSNGQVTTVQIPGTGYHSAHDAINGGNGIIWIIYGNSIKSYKG